jgi:fructokinase
LVQVDPHRATGTVAVEVTGGEPRFAIATEAAWDAIVYSDAVAQAVVDADVLYYGTLAQRTALGSGALRQAWLQAPKACLRVCDVNIRAPAPPSAVVKASLAAADAVKLNEQELAFLANMFDVKTPVRWLMEEFGIGLVALTRGERGCAMFRPDMQVEHDGFPISDGQGDPVGAGDAFTAVLCDALARGIGIGSRSALEALAERANRIASYVASCPGATPALPDRLC